MILHVVMIRLVNIEVSHNLIAAIAYKLDAVAQGRL